MVYSDGSSSDNRQGRIGSSATEEAPSSKAKREQALRSILTARRRQLLGPRLSDLSKKQSAKVARPVALVPKDPLDVLDAQETRHGVYVTAPLGDQVSVMMSADDEDALELLSRENLTTGRSHPGDGEIEQPPDSVDDSTKNSLLIRINETQSPWALPESKANETAPGKNISQAISRSQKIFDNENRRKNTVAMPESLYNHFRPVESNIPVEDMSQFLYFGQKLNPDSQNNPSKNNNSLLDGTSTASNGANSRRRYPTKRLGTTTPTAVSRLENIMNEEMSMELERSTIERNKIPKMKNVLRNVGSGTYYRKAAIRPSDSIIVSNVILARETPRNSSVLSYGQQRENVLSRTSGGPGAAAGGDAGAPVDGDQAAAAAATSVESAEESELGPDSIAVAASAHRAWNHTNDNDSTQFRRAHVPEKDERRHQRERNVGAMQRGDKRLGGLDGEYIGDSKSIPKTGITDESVSRSSINRDYVDAQVASTSRNELINRITTWQSVHETTTFSADFQAGNDPRLSFSTMNDLTGPADSKLSSIIPTVTTNAAPSSPLRIIVTEPVSYDVKDQKEATRQGDEEKEKNVYAEASRGVLDRGSSRKNQTVYGDEEYEGSPEYSRVPRPTATTSSSPDRSTENTSVFGAPSPSGSRVMRNDENVPVSPVNTVESASKSERSEQHGKQQHAYAYEITNVTRLLRNYTGPGLNIAVEERAKEEEERGTRRKESGQTEQGEKEKEAEEEKRKNTSGKKEKKLRDERSEERERNAGATGAKGKGEGERGPALTRSSAGSIPEIRNVGGSVQPTPRRQPPLPLVLPTPRREAASSSSNGGGKVEPARTTGQLSAGTDVGEGTAASVSGRDDGDRDRGAAGAASVLGAGARAADAGGSGGGGGGGGNDIETSNTPIVASTPFVTSQPARVENPSLRGNLSAVTSLPKFLIRARSRDEVTQSAILASTLRWNHTGNNGLPDEREDFLGKDRQYLRKPASAVLNQRTLEEGIAREVKRRRGGSSFSTASGNHRRLKAPRNGPVDEDTKISVSKYMQNRTAQTNDEYVPSQVTVNLSAVTPSTMETQSPESTSQIDGIFETGTTLLPATTIESPLTEETNAPLPEAAPKEALASTSHPTTNFRSNKVLTTIKVPDGNSAATSTSESVSSPARATTNSVQTTPISVTATTTTTTTTTAAPPVFPVTPRMLEEPRDGAGKIESKSVDETKTEANGPFGLAKDLDPSEIQKMYRSQTTPKAEPSVATMLPEFEESTNPSLDLTTQERPRPVYSASNASISRSPEVRGRNLSDKSNENDDILPIMELYNASSIFNATGKDSPDSVNTAKTTLQLPGSDEPRPGSPDEITTTEETPEPAQRPTGRRNEQHNSSDSSGISRKNNKQPIDREHPHVHRIPTKISNSTGHESASNSSQPNRTRYRPSYQQTAVPEFFGYRPEFNSSFFEPGMMAVSPRESINISEVVTKRHDGDTLATQETVAVVSYILATLVVFPIAVGVGLILRRLIIKNRKVLEESDTSSEISCRKDALNLENGDFKTSIEKAITKLPRIQHLCHEAEKPPPPPSQESERWEFPRDKLRLQTVLGQGNFGQVWKAEADDLTGHQGTTRLVAVKTVKEGASAREKEDLVRELEIMQQLGNHPNVVTLLGCCTEEEPHYLILEYVMYGKLLAYLRDHRTRQDFYNFSEDSAALTSRDLTVFGYCVARGMEYLASKKIIHRDLAARNVLVDHNKLCKIADFGMSRFANEDGEVIEARHGRNALPIRWMAPESLIYSLFTTKTDVWSFGILMWEIVTLGSTPYPDMAAREVMRNVQNGYRLERPSHCRSELFRVISRCWHADPDRRPEFQTLRRDMAQLLEDNLNGHYVDLESFASECTD
ncbi:serine-rich adhesin for platelets-like isoform X2 [Venturia canescens]|uniref:serine-rich adhesin for platelets-like isoform X2 n=1 Tax=Venturia canescens TaxID=32260 RepID=UPI001C9CF325|nr:serine-rich adhesin for platelets-like isoform X2 [Venturia canescens]